MELYFCEKCGRRISEGDLAGGGAVDLGGEKYCAACAKAHPEVRSALARRAARPKPPRPELREGAPPRPSGAGGDAGTVGGAGKGGSGLALVGGGAAFLVGLAATFLVMYGGEAPPEPAARRDLAPGAPDPEPPPGVVSVPVPPEPEPEAGPQEPEPLTELFAELDVPEEQPGPAVPDAPAPTPGGPASGEYAGGLGPVPEGAREFVVDNADRDSFAATGAAAVKSEHRGHHGPDYCHGWDTATFRPEFAHRGVYEVHMIWPPHGSRTSALPVRIAHAGGVDRKTVDMSAGGGEWRLVGRYEFERGGSGAVELSAPESGSYVADAIRLVPVGSAATEEELARARAEGEAREALASALDEFAELMTKGEHARARERMVETADGLGEGDSRRTALAAAEVAGVLAERGPELAARYRELVGADVLLGAGGGRVAGRLEAVGTEGLKLLTTYRINNRERTRESLVRWESLSDAETASRLAGWREGDPAREVARAFASLAAGDAAGARAALERAGEHPLRGWLADRMASERKARETAAREAAAEGAWNAFKSHLPAGRMTHALAARLHERLRRLIEEHGESRFVTSRRDEAEALLKRLKVLATVEFVVNGGFETGSAEPWRLVKGDQRVVVAADAPEGRYALDTGSDHQELAQEIRLEVGATYRLRAWVKSKGAGDYCDFLVNDQKVIHLDHFKAPGGRRVEATFTAPAAECTLVMKHKRSRHATLVDAISIVREAPAGPGP